MHLSQISELLGRLRESRPLVHHITNYVTINDCANITLFIGAAPVMAEAKEEVADMVSLAGALVLNIGTLRREQVDAMLIAGHKANELGIPIVMDPVGAGATKYRTEVASRLIQELQIAIVKGNPGEIGTVAGSGGVVRGVDSEGIKGDPVQVCRSLADAAGVTVIMSGPSDIVTDGERTVLVDNGHELMGKISGTGCMASSLVGAFAAIADDHTLTSVAALASFGIAGERAAKRTSGPYAFKAALLDEVASLSPQTVTQEAKIRTL
jgi:hydroxyethylthiazole kinase